MILTDELHALALGRKIIRNLHLAGVVKKNSESSQKSGEEVREPVCSPEELRGVIPADARKSYDIRSVIARIVDGSEFDEFKKLYGSVSFSHYCVKIQVARAHSIMDVSPHELSCYDILWVDDRVSKLQIYPLSADSFSSI